MTSLHHHIYQCLTLHHPRHHHYIITYTNASHYIITYTNTSHYIIITSSHIPMPHITSSKTSSHIPMPHISDKDGIGRIWRRSRPSAERSHHSHPLPLIVLHVLNNRANNYATTTQRDVGNVCCYRQTPEKHSTPY